MRAGLKTRRITPAVWTAALEATHAAQARRPTLLRIMIDAIVANRAKVEVGPSPPQR